MYEVIGTGKRPRINPATGKLPQKFGSNVRQKAPLLEKLMPEHLARSHVEQLRFFVRAHAKEVLEKQMLRLKLSNVKLQEKEILLGFCRNYWRLFEPKSFQERAKKSA